MRLFSATVLALLAATGLTAAWIAALPLAMAERLVWAGLLFPLLWPALVFWVYWPEQPRLPLIALGLTTVLSCCLVLAL